MKENLNQSEKESLVCDRVVILNSDHLSRNESQVCPTLRVSVLSDSPVPTSRAFNSTSQSNSFMICEPASDSL